MCALRRLAFAMLALIVSPVEVAAAAPDEALLARLAAAGTVRLVVEQAYGAARWPGSLDAEPVPGFRLPFVGVAEALLSAAGVRVVGAGGEGHEATLRITARGLALSRTYHGGVAGLLFTGARLDGGIVFSGPGVPAWRTRFAARRRPLLRIALNLGYERPSNAPFVEVFGHSGSFLPRMVEVVGAVYGAAPLIAVIGEENGEALRRGAAHVLGALGDAAAVDPLIAALADADAGLRREAAWALGRLGEARAVAPLEVALADSDADVRWFAAWALARITGRSLDDVLAAGVEGRKAEAARAE